MDNILRQFACKVVYNIVIFKLKVIFKLNNRKVIFKLKQQEKENIHLQK